MPNAIDSKTKREKLAPRREPHWARLEKGLSVGYRKPETGNGTWIARLLTEEGKKQYRALGSYEHFDDAAKDARAWRLQCDQGASHKAVTVSEVCKSYVDALKAEKRNGTAKDAEGRFNRLVHETAFGSIELDRLRSTTVEKWLHDQVDDSDDADEDDIRRSKDSANRNLSTLKAALNRALKHRMVASDSGWKTVTSFGNVAERRKDAYLSADDRKELLAACDDALAKLANAMLHTGARPGELANLNVSNFDARNGTLTLNGKTGARTVPVSSAAAMFFADLTKDRIGNAPMLTDAYGQRWNKDTWKDPFKAAVRAAKLPDAVVMYSLRHTAISDLVMAGIDSFIVAKLAGTSVAMIESNYGHLRIDAVRAKLDAAGAKAEALVNQFKAGAKIIPLHNVA